jgi:hypothetical protein
MLGFLCNKQYDYRLYLCKPNKEQLFEIDYLDINFTQNFRSFNELEFEVPYCENGWELKEDTRFDLTKALYLVLLNITDGDTVIFDEYYIIDNPEASQNDGITKKQIHCFASHYMTFNKRILRGYNDVKLLYDPSNPTVPTAGIINYLLSQLYGTWTVSYINAIYLNVYHSFNYSSSTFTEVFKDLEEQYNCFIFFDNTNNTIQIKSPNEVGIDSDLVLSNTNYIKSISNTNKSNELITRLRVYGKDNISISKYNPTGQFFIDNFNWLLDNRYFSTGLAASITAFNALLVTKIGVFEGYLVQLEGFEAQLLQAQNELNDLQGELLVIKQNLQAEKIANYSNSANYNIYYLQQVSKLAEIVAKELEITGYESQITGVNNNITILRNEISYSTNFTQDELEELSLFIYESDLTLGSCDDEENLYEYATQYIIKKSVPIIDIDIDLIDFLSSNEAQLDWTKLVSGNYAYIDCSELGYDYYQTRIVRISHSKLSNSLSVTLSNADKINSEILYLNEIFKVANQAANNITVNQDAYGQYTQDQDTIIYTNDTITNTIDAGDTIIDQLGIWGNGSSTNRLQIVGDKIIFSSDDYENYYTILSASKGLYLETSDGLATIEINPDVGFKIQKSDGLGGWVNSLYIDVLGNATFSGSIKTTTDAFVGSALIIGNMEDFDKAIYFYNDGGAGVAGITLDTDGDFIIQNGYGDVYLSTPNNIWISCDIKTYIWSDSIDISSDNRLALTSTEEEIFITGHDGIWIQSGNSSSSTGYIYITIFDGSGNLEIYNYGTGVIKIESQGNMSINSIGGYVFAQGTWRFDYDPYVGAVDVNNKLLKKSEMDSTYAPISHSHSYATSSDISDAIDAHVLAYH